MDFCIQTGPVDIWINNAGINHPGDPFHELDATIAFECNRNQH